MNVYIGGAKDYSAMQGPCDVGFHVPTNTEFYSLYNTGVNMGAWSGTLGTNFCSYLKIPLAGYWIYNNSIISDRGTRCYYWTSSPQHTGYAMGWVIESSLISWGSGYAISYTINIRPFKDTPVVPDSGWTVLYQGTGDAGIYHNSTLGLISISSDGINWITISDKNLGATAVYNSGDTLSEANCGKYYQWGNNYGFPFSGPSSTSSAQVDASAYGPGNYYSSSTLIKVNPRDSSGNKNLRGGVTGIVSPVELKNAYIGEYDFTNYQQVEYIGRNGNNYIDTGWIPIMSKTWEVHIGYKVSSGSNRYAVLGNYNGQGGNISLEITAQNQGRFYMDTGSGSTGFATNNTISTSSFNEMVFKNNLNSSGTVTLNGTSTSGTIYTGGYYNASAYIFIDRKLRWTTFTQDSYVSYCKIYEDGTLVRDFVPCYRKSDSVIGLYDLANEQFYTNSGSGTFSKGADAN